MRAFRLLMLLVVFLCLVPILALIGAGAAARVAGCDLDPGQSLPCPVLGSDYGDELFSVLNFGMHTVEAIAVLGALIVVWVIVEIVAAIGRKPRNPRPSQQDGGSRDAPRPWRKSPPQAPAASRKRARGS
ncbi:hypothetical protein T281_17130 [Rhodomicrobium udaipurense JA643]|uniref:Uncharacterized protein n=1 Tax=Rhodomicrobium udaipurense TaxID=1202716 RepID=A0A8I1GGM5_9HYPH|nr:hypothetical protein [Rhodomicrobium udaipurense]KAI93367.1 hypothetical protein T281_17130 [Rhodomicrobium udaipurense JA643]MBJ7544484.1 hypothetical protein [Rhodomicrobium udaipurense]